VPLTNTKIFALKAALQPSWEKIILWHNLFIDWRLIAEFFNKQEKAKDDRMQRIGRRAEKDFKQ